MSHVDPIIRAEYQRAYRERNATRLAEYQKVWRVENPEATKAAKRAEYEKHADAYKARAKAHRERNFEAIKARRSTPEFRAARNAERRARYAADETHRKSLLEFQKNQREARGPEMRAKRRERNAKKPFWIKRYERGLNKAYFNGAEIVERESVRSYYHQVFTQTAAVCDYCRGLFPIRDITLDHKQPYALGGCHSVSNLAVSCHNCNRHKHTTPYDKWVAFKGGS